MISSDFEEYFESSTTVDATGKTLPIVVTCNELIWRHPVAGTSILQNNLSKQAEKSNLVKCRTTHRMSESYHWFTTTSTARTLLIAGDG